MAIDPGTMQQMLAQKLMQGPQQASAGGGGSGPQMQANQSGPVAGAAQVLQKILAMKALQQGQQQQQAQGMLPGTQQQIAQDPQMQALQQPGQMSPFMANPQIPQQ
jgi:hypothetical protein